MIAKMQQSDGNTQFESPPIFEKWVLRMYPKYEGGIFHVDLCWLELPDHIKSIKVRWDIKISALTVKTPVWENIFNTDDADEWSWGAKILTFDKFKAYECDEEGMKMELNMQIMEIGFVDGNEQKQSIQKENKNIQQISALSKRLDNMDKSMKKKLETLSKSLTGIKHKVEIDDDTINKDQRDIQEWLRKMNMVQYYQNFIDQGFLNISTICEISNDQLVQIGVKLMGHRLEILRHIKLYKQHGMQKPMQIRSLSVDDNDKEDQYKQVIKDVIECYQPSSPNGLIKKYYRKCLELKNIVESQYNVNEITYINQENMDYKDQIDEFVKLNNHNNAKHQMVIIGKKSVVRQIDIVEVYDIRRHPRLAVNGQKGLKSKVFIKKGTVIGEYTAKYLIDEDLDRLQGSRLFHNINRFAFTERIEVKMSMEQIKYFQSADMDLSKKRKRRRFVEDSDDEEEQNVNITSVRSRNHNYNLRSPSRKRLRVNNNKALHMNRNNKGENELRNHSFNIILDGYKQQCLLSKMNDYRNDLELLHNDDCKEHWNIKFVAAYYEGWPRIFGVCIQDIQAGTELLSWYGDYIGVVKEREKLMQRDIKLKQILTPIGLDYIVDKLQ